jgi:hypothetical protein
VAEAPEAPEAPATPEPPAPTVTAEALEQTAASAPDEGDADEEVVETIEIVEVEHETRGAWMGMRFGTVVTPFRNSGPVRPGNVVNSNSMKACLDPGDVKYCGYLRGLDARIEFFKAGGTWSYPRWVGYFRTGYSAGRRSFLPQSREGFEPGEARSMAYTSVPVFVGGNVYLFKKFPVRPYGGLGFGFDVVRLQYQRQGERSQVDVSARVGFELHAGLEARITNYVSLNAEVTQQWSAKRKLDGVPDFSNEGMTFMVGAAFAIPTSRKTTRHRVRKVRTVHRK